MINLLPLLEAKDSSEIENIVTTTDKLFEYIEADSQADHATKEALRYRTALYQGYKSLAGLATLYAESSRRNSDLDNR